MLILDRPSVLGAVERLRVQGVDGILVITPQEEAAEALVNLPSGVPVVPVTCKAPVMTEVPPVKLFAVPETMSVSSASGPCRRRDLHGQRPAPGAQRLQAPTGRDRRPEPPRREGPQRCRRCGYTPS